MYVHCFCLLITKPMHLHMQYNGTTTSVMCCKTADILTICPEWLFGRIAAETEERQQGAGSFYPRLLMVLEGHIRGSSYHPFLTINTLGSVSSPENLMESLCGTGVTLSAGERRALRMTGKEGRRGEDTGTTQIRVLKS